MNGKRAKQIRELATKIAENPQYSGIPYKVIYKDLKKRYKANKGKGVV